MRPARNFAIQEQCVLHTVVTLFRDNSHVDLFTNDNALVLVAILDRAVNFNLRFFGLRANNEKARLLYCCSIVVF
jgi:hypothetical protein